MKLYHFTDIKYYKKVLRTGKLFPYKIDTTGDSTKKWIVGMLKDWFDSDKGIYLWKNMNKKLCRDFYYYQNIVNSVKVGVILEVHIDKKDKHLLSDAYKKTHPKDALKLSHNFNMGTDEKNNMIKHNNQLFDIYTNTIPIAFIKPLWRVELQILDFIQEI